MKRYLAQYILLLITCHIYAQGTIKGSVVDGLTSEPLIDVVVSLEDTRFTTRTNLDGTFALTGELPQGDQILVLTRTSYVTKRLPVIILRSTPLELYNIPLNGDITLEQQQIGVISLSDNEITGDNDDLGNFNVSGLLSASRDAFLRAAAFDFSAAFFRPRGLDNANSKVLINGIEMNKQFNGRPQFNNWGGINDLQRNQEFAQGLAPSEYAFGGFAGTTNIILRASQYRKGGSISYASANRSYTGRVMASYASGLQANGWSYAFLASRRFGDEGFVDGTIYDANSFFGAVEKKINDQHSINFTGFFTPNRRGRSTAITQEVFELRGRRYNPNWGFQNGEIRNTRERDIQEPVFTLNHYWNVSKKTKINTNLGYQFGTIKNSRVDNGGTRLITTPDGQEAFIGGARNPIPNFFQLLPSFFLQDPNPTATDFQNAFLAEQEFINDGQFDIEALFRGNAISVANGGNAIFVIQDDVIQDTQFSANVILSTAVSDNVTVNANVAYRGLNSANFAEVADLLGGNGYLDVDFFAEDDVTNSLGAGDAAQSDLRNRNRIVGVGDRYKYNYEIDANVISSFGQAQFKYNKVDFFASGSLSNTSYQRNGLFENGNFPGARSFGQSEQLSFTNFGLKGGITYKPTGRHLVTLNAGFATQAPGIRNSFTNARQNNDTVIGLESEEITSADLSYVFRSPIIKARLTGFYNTLENQIDINFFFTENAQGAGDGFAFVQEVLTGINTRRIGAELGFEAQVTPTIKLKAAASFGEYVFTDDANQYLAGDDFLGQEFIDENPEGFPEGTFVIGDGDVALENFHVASGPERVAQLGFEYRDPNFWWVGATANYFDRSFIDVSTLRRSDAFILDTDGLPINDFDPVLGREFLRQIDFGDYVLINLVGGKSWKIDDYFVGFFATINNVFNEQFISGGFEQSRIATFRELQAETNASGGPLFGPRFFYGNGATYFVNVYFRF